MFPLFHYFNEIFAFSFIFKEMNLCFSIKEICRLREGLAVPQCGTKGQNFSEFLAQTHISFTSKAQRNIKDHCWNLGSTYGPRKYQAVMFGWRRRPVQWLCCEQENSCKVI